MTDIAVVEVILPELIDVVEVVLPQEIAVVEVIARGPPGPPGPPGDIVEFETLADAEGASIHQNVTRVIIWRYDEGGVQFGTLYLEQESEPDHALKFQAFDGRWFAPMVRELVAFSAGARNDDATDNQAAIQRGLAYLEEMGGGALGFLPGTYRSSQFSIPSNVRLFGTSRDWCILKPTASIGRTTAFIGTQDVDTLTPARQASGIVFEDLGFDGSLRTWSAWLSTFPDETPVTDPEEDYFVNNPAGKIGNPDAPYAPVPEGVALSQTLAGPGNITINGSLAVAGAVTLASIRRVILHIEEEIEGVAFTISGTNLDGNPISEVRHSESFPGSDTFVEVESRLAYKTITSIAVAAAIGPVSVGVGGFGIDALTLEDGRRNKNYNQLGPCIALQKCIRPIVRRCAFRNYRSMVISDQGCLAGRYHDNLFEFCLKPDTANFCIWVQSFGNPDAPGASYQDSEDTWVYRNEGYDLDRIFSLFAPPRGGRIFGNTLKRVKEAGLFIPDSANIRGTQYWVDAYDNEVDDVRMSDITAVGMESIGTSRVRFFRNRVSNVEASFLTVFGGADKYFDDNVFDTAFVRAFTVPYGPFSERFGFARLDDPIAGDTFDGSTDAMFRVGTRGADGSLRTYFRRNVIQHHSENIPLAVFKQVRIGASGVSFLHVTEDITVEENDCRQLPTELLAGSRFWNTDTPLVFSDEMDLTIRRNHGHASYESKVIARSWAIGETGTVTFEADDLGFRPSKITCFASAATAAEGLTSHSMSVYNRSTPAPDTDLTGAIRYTLPTTPPSALVGNTMARLVASGNVVVFLMSLNGWVETGFRVFVQTVDIAVSVTFICEP